MRAGTGRQVPVPPPSGGKNRGRGLYIKLYPPAGAGGGRGPALHAPGHGGLRRPSEASALWRQRGEGRVFPHGPVCHVPGPAAAVAPGRGHYGLHPGLQRLRVRPGCGGFFRRAPEGADSKNRGPGYSPGAPEGVPAGGHQLLCRPGAAQQGKASVLAEGRILQRLWLRGLYGRFSRGDGPLYGVSGRVGCALRRRWLPVCPPG